MHQTPARRSPWWLALPMMALSPHALATTGPEANSNDCSQRDAYVIEHNYTRTALDFTINYTDRRNGGVIVDSDHVGEIAAGGQSGKREIPDKAKKLTLCDVVNHTRAIGNPGGGGGGAGAGPDDIWSGAEHDQKFEVLYKDPATGKYVQQSIFHFLALAYGGEEIPFIDFWFDTSGDGTIDASDHMYALYDIGEYTHSGTDSIAALRSRFAPGQAVDILNGRIAGVDGLYFNTTAFTFDENTGYQGTNYSGKGYGVTDHTLYGQLPEPASLALALSALAVAGMGSRRARQRHGT
ncbi:MAG: hypothetical protein HY020_13375 [Burkholderiales bacterium]|nr:hypothetical protein [Burkholderiales bacterium]